MLVKFKKSVLITTLASISVASIAAEKTIYGRYEKIKVLGVDKTIHAKLDTGARTSSLSAKDIKIFTKDGERWVRFTPQIKGEAIKPLEYPLLKVSKIKRKAGDILEAEEAEDEADSDERFISRPEIRMKVCLGKHLKEIDVNLTDRSSFIYPFLIGAQALKEFKAVVDPSLKYQSDPSCSIK